VIERPLHNRTWIAGRICEIQMHLGEMQDIHDAILKLVPGFAPMAYAVERRVERLLRGLRRQRRLLRVQRAYPTAEGREAVEENAGRLLALTDAFNEIVAIQERLMAGASRRDS
jgi:hypothetical protein